MLLFNNSEVEMSKELLTETTVGKFMGDDYKIDISTKKQSGKHRARVKICRTESKGNGTSVPIITGDGGKYLPYEIFDNNSACEIEKETEQFKPLVVGFAALYQKELHAFINGDQTQLDFLKKEGKSFADKYMNRQKTKILVSKIKSDLADKIMQNEY